MKSNHLKFIASVAIVVALIFIIPQLFISKTDTLAQKAETSTKTIIVTGTGEIDKEPDMASIHLGAESIASTAEQAQKEIDQIIKKIKEVAVKYEIDEKHIRTEYFQVYPINDMNGETQTKRYQASHSLQIKLMDINKLGSFIDDATKAGANQINQVSFGLQNSDEAEQEALKKAIARAKVKAEAIAEGANKKLGDYMQIAEQSARIQPYYSNVEESMMVREQSAITPGEVKVSQSIDIVFEMK